MTLVAIVGTAAADTPEATAAVVIARDVVEDEAGRDDEEET